MKEKHLTIYDIARMAEVSPSMVSRVLNGSGYVAKEKKERIRKVIEESGYQPNALAQGLSTKRSRTIGMLVPDVINPFFASVFVELERQAIKYNYNVVLCNYSSDNELTIRQTDLLRQKQVDAIFQMGGPTDRRDLPEETAESIKNMTGEIPVITNGNTGSGRFHSVLIDDAKAIDTMLREAYEMGHRRFALLGGSERYIPTYEKQEQFRKTLRELGIPEEDILIMDYDNFDQYGGIHAVEILCERCADNMPTFLGGINEAVAIGMEKELRRRGIRIPEDVSMVSFDNTYLSELAEPELSSIGCNYVEYADLVLKNVMEILDQKEAEKRSVSMESSYVRRASVGSCGGPVTLKEVRK
jgi:LacI family transcriptional regulator